MKTKQICIYKDEKHEKTEWEKFDSQVKKLIKAISLYENLTGQKLETGQWKNFLNNPCQLIKDVFLRKIEVPNGMIREQYFKLIETPDTSEIKSLVVGEYLFPELLHFDGEKVTLTEAAVKTITAKNIYIDASHEPMYKAAQKVAAAVNELRKFKEYEADDVVNRRSFLKQDETKEWEVNPAYFNAVFVHGMY